MSRKTGRMVFCTVFIMLMLAACGRGKEPGGSGTYLYYISADGTTPVSYTHLSDARKLMDEGYIGGGMLPKLHNCIDAIEHGVSRVHILDGRIPHCLLLEIFTNKGIGTAILNDGAQQFYYGE